LLAAGWAEILAANEGNDEKDAVDGDARDRQRNGDKFCSKPM
jgi:hypothetical protein